VSDTRAGRQQGATAEAGARILLEAPEYSYRADKDPFDNGLFFCDNKTVGRFLPRFVTETTRGGPFLMIPVQP
jgi:hypothetical protein